MEEDGEFGDGGWDDGWSGERRVEWSAWSGLVRVVGGFDGGWMDGRASGSSSRYEKEGVVV